LLLQTIHHEKEEVLLQTKQIIQERKILKIKNNHNRQMSSMQRLRLHNKRMSKTTVRLGTCSQMMQKIKKRRGFAWEEKKMMSIWHKACWRKQEGHSKKNFHSPIA